MNGSINKDKHVLKKIHGDKNPIFCVITPLKPGDKISKETKISVKRNNYPFIWVSYESDNNVARNFKLGFEELQSVGKSMFGYVKFPPYTIKIDNDCIWNRNTLDHMVDCLYSANRVTNEFAYSYVSFEYQGSVNQKFPARDFNPNDLRKMNYISSNSMFKSAILRKISIVDSDYYKRLLDWAYYLKLLNNGYLGVPCEKGYFVAKSSVDSISAGSKEDFHLKYSRVREDFVLNPK